MKLIIAALSLLTSLACLAQDVPCIKVTLSYNGASILGDTSEPFLVTIENAGNKPIKLLRELIVHYEDDEDERSNIYFITYYWDRYGLTAFNYKMADIDYVVDLFRSDTSEYRWLKPGEKVFKRSNPFRYSGFVKGEVEYHVECVFRIRERCGDIVYKSNYVNVNVK